MRLFITKPPILSGDFILVLDNLLKEKVTGHDGLKIETSDKKTSV